MIPSSSAGDSLLRRGKWTYICALLLIAVLILGSHVTLDSILQRQADTAQLVNLSGRQRMLSQRIVKIALERSLHRVPYDDAAGQKKLKEAVDRMSTIHDGLMHGSSKLHLAPPTGPTLEIYSGSQWKLDAQVRSFLFHAGVLANRPAAALSMSDPDLLALEAAADQPLLNALDAAVIASQQYSEQSIDHLRTLLAVITGLMLFVLAAEAVLLFRPLFRRLTLQQEHLFRISRTDPLTGCFNRRGFEGLGSAAIDHARRASEALSVLSLDLDHFKVVNDTYGHAAGDLVLQTFVATLMQHIRSSDLLCRVGGEEFILVLPLADQAGLVALADRFRQAVEHTPIKFGSRQLRITVSLGAATLDPADETLHDLIARADLALYDAKRGGRNRVALAAAPAPTGKPERSLSLSRGQMQSA